MSEPFQTLFQALGLTLVHFCWQGALIALAAKLVDLSLPNLRPRGRYAVSLGALVIMGVAAVMTFAYEHIRLSRDTHLGGETAAAFSSAFARQGFDVMDLLPWITAMWALGVLVLSARMLAGLLAIQRLKAQARKVPDALEARFSRAVRALGLRHVQLRMHAGIDSPFVVGIFRSVIYLPVSAVTTLSPDQIDAVLAHELEHIRRADFAWNLIQTVMETVFFYHPAVWWLGRTLREQRELACDDAAVRSCADPVTYATALLRLEEQRRISPRLAVALNGNGSGPTLLSRIRRVLGDTSQGTPSMTTRNAPRSAILAVPLTLATLAAFALPAAQVAAGTEGSFSKSCKIRSASLQPIAFSDSNVLPTDETPAAEATEADVEPKDFWSGLLPRKTEAEDEMVVEANAGGRQEWGWIGQAKDWSMINTSAFLGEPDLGYADAETLKETAIEIRLEAERMQSHDSVQARAMRQAADRMAEQARLMAAEGDVQARHADAQVREADHIRIQAEAHARAADAMARDHEMIARRAEAQARAAEAMARDHEAIARMAEAHARKAALDAEKMARKIEARFNKKGYWEVPAPPAPPLPPLPPADLPALPDMPAPPAPLPGPAPMAHPAPPAMPGPIAAAGPIEVKTNVRVKSAPVVVITRGTNS